MGLSFAQRTMVNNNSDKNTENKSSTTENAIKRYSKPNVYDDTASITKQTFAANFL